MGSQRTIITISDEDKLWLENYSRSYGISLAEAIRRGIARLKDGEWRGEVFLPINSDNLVKSPKTVMPDLIRHPEVIEFTGFRLSPE